MYVDSGKYRGLVRLCGVKRWPAGLLYVPRGVLLAYWRVCSKGRGRGGMEHASMVLLQQRAACETPPHEPAHVCLLMHVGAEQARTRLQERERVSPATLVRDGCDMMPAYPI
jgi:hypothetical protein